MDLDPVGSRVFSKETMKYTPIKVPAFIKQNALVIDIAVFAMHGLPKDCFLNAEM